MVVVVVTNHNKDRVHLQRLLYEGKKHCSVRGNAVSQLEAATGFCNLYRSLHRDWQRFV